jgi:hypothetical protein
VVTPGLSIVIVTGGSVLTTTVFPASPLTVPRGSTVACVSDGHTPQPGTIAGTVSSSIAAPSGRNPIGLPNAGTFTFACALNPGITVTITVL